MKIKSHKKMLNKISPKIHPWGTLNKSYSHEFMLNLFWVFFLGLVKYSCTNLSESILDLVPILVGQYRIRMHLILQLKGNVKGNKVP